MRRTAAAFLGTLVVGLMSSAPARADSPEAGTGTLIVRFEGLKSDQGTVALAMWNAEEYWLSDGNTVRDGAVEISDGTAMMVIEDLPYGDYGVSAYHDKNGNGKLDTGLFRIPKEPIGTSNDAKVRFGPPKYQDARFRFAVPELEITIPMRKIF